MTPVRDKTEVTFSWKRVAAPGIVEVEMHVRGDTFGRLVPGVSPGWSRLAIKEGPLAKPLFQSP